MISVEEALDLVIKHKKNFGEETVTLLSSLDRILSENIFADRDFPPFDRVAMDGIAVNSKALETGERNFFIENIQPAGNPNVNLGQLNNCIEVMTGAVVPGNTDVVIPYEHCKIENGIATVLNESFIPFQNVQKQGSDIKAGECLMHAHQKITAAAIGVLASIGKSEVQVLRLPKVALFSTGNELVGIEKVPGTHQVRMSNTYVIAAALKKNGIDCVIDHLQDDVMVMKHMIERSIKRNDALIFSGAVSRGKYDYLPEVLSQLGMKTIFHGVAQRPGKPFLFGAFQNGPVVFAFPGNPVSTFICFYKYFFSWMRASLNQEQESLFAQLSTDFSFKPELTIHLLVSAKNENGVIVAAPQNISSSGDIAQINKANAFISLPADRDYFFAGEKFPLCYI